MSQSRAAMRDSHRRFLQTVMYNGIVSEQVAKSLHQHCCETHHEQYVADGLDDFIGVINSQLQPVFMNLRKGLSEDDAMQYYALVNTAETHVTRMSSDYNDSELEVFKKVIDLIVGSDTGTASSTDILNSTDALQTKKLKKSETEHLLDRLVLEKWLNEKRGDYSLSTRCILEMEPYILTMYADQVKMCHICHNIALQSQMCENPLCGIKIHNPCAAKYFKGRREPKCPACNEVWSLEIPVVGPSPSQPRR